MIGEPTTREDVVKLADWLRMMSADANVHPTDQARLAVAATLLGGEAGPAWDRSTAYRMMRRRYIHYMDLVQRLMRDELKLLKLCGEKTFESLTDLNQRAEQVRKLGGDASAIEAEAAELRAQRDTHAPRLNEVQDALAAARECLKWSDMASEGMHWLCFSEPRCEAAARESEATLVAATGVEGGPGLASNPSSKDPQ